jgi:ubiquinone/menaquinone biosynthesis C-methylase UbiE
MILDATCGAKLMYKGLHEAFNQGELVFMDIREGDFPTFGRRKQGETITVQPDKVGCITSIPWPDESFSMVIVDPPHAGRWGKNSFMAALYGSWDRDTFVRRFHKANDELYRVLKPGGVLLLKVQDNEGRDKIAERLLTKFKLLLKIQQVNSSGRTGHKTFWMHFIRKKEGSDE